MRLKMYRIGIYCSDRIVGERLKKMNQNKVKVYTYISENELRDEIMHDALRSDILIISMQNHNRQMIELAREIQGRNHAVIIILLLEAIADISNIFELEPTYLLVKPVSEQKLFATVAKAIQKLEKNSSNMLQLCFKNRLIKIPYQEIMYIESDKRYIEIHYAGKSERALMKLDAVLKKLPDYFARCHQSYVVNVRRITKWEGNIIYMEHNVSIPISKNRLKETKEIIHKYYN